MKIMFYKIKSFFKRHKQILFLVAINTVFLLFYLCYLYTCFDTNDDVALNFIANGSYGINMAPYLIFENIIYGYILKILYLMTSALNWYVVLPLGLAVFMNVYLSYYMLRKFSFAISVVFTVLIMLLFGNYIYGVFQFTHLAGFFSATGLFLLYVGLVSEERTMFQSSLGVFYAVLGFCIRYDAFLSIAAVFFLAIIAYLLKESFWKISIHKIFGRLLPIFLLLLLASVAFISNKLAYSLDDNWNMYLTYNSYRSGIIDYGMPDYDTYTEDYNRIGIDKLDWQLFRSWSQADLNKFSLETVKAMYDLKQDTSMAVNYKVSAEGFMVTFVNLFHGFLAIPICILLMIYILFMTKKNKWIVAPFFVIIFESFYLFIKGRFIFRSYFGLWVLYGLILLYQYFMHAKPKLDRKYSLTLMTSVFILNLPVFFQLISLNKINLQLLSTQEKDTQWIEKVSQDEGSLYVYDLYDINKIQPVIIYKEKGHIFDTSQASKNVYSLGGWTYPSPIAAAVFGNYNIKVNEIYPSLYDDEKNLYYVMNKGGTNIETQLKFLQKEYNENINYERVNEIENVEIFRFYLDEFCNVENLKITNTSIVNNHEIIELDRTVDIKGTILLNDVDPYKQNIWVAIHNTDNNQTIYKRANKALDFGIEERYGILHSNASGYSISIDRDIFKNGYNQVNLIIESEENTYEIEKPIYEDVK